MSRRGVVICGYYGFGNVGDEAVLKGFIWGARQAGWDRPITVMSADTAQTRQQHGVEAIPRTDLPLVWQRLRHAEAFVLGGGSLIQDVTSARSVVYYLGVNWLARQARCPTLWLGQGIGPVQRRWARWWLRHEARQARWIVVRDAFSAQLLGEGTRCEVGADLSFLLPAPDPELGWQHLSHLGVSRGEPLVAIAPRPWKTQTLQQTASLFRKMMEQMIREWQVKILLLPMQPDRDLPLCEQLAQTAQKVLILREDLSVDIVRAVLACCQMVMAMRLHALMLGAAVGVPALALSYDPKVRSFWAQVEPRHVVDFEGADLHCLHERAQEVWQQRQQLRKRVQVYAQQQQRLAWASIRALREVVS